MKYSKAEADTLLIALTNTENNLRTKQSQISLLRRNLTALKDTQTQDRHKDGQTKLDKNRRPILITQRPIDPQLGIEMSEERRDAIFTKIMEDSKNL